MKNIIILAISVLLISCGSNKQLSLNDDSVKNKYAAEIKAKDIKEHLYILASDILEGRRTGEKGQKMAANYITAFYKNLGLKAPEGHDNYLQEIPKAFFNGKSNADSENVVAYISGSEKPDEIIVISAHYDHLGMDGEEVFNGADDDASGTSAVLEIAQAFQKAKKDGYGPKRSILFLNLTGEEEGLYGSKYYTSHPLFPLENTVVNLNIDMVGRVDKKHEDKPNYIYLIGADKLSSELHKLSEQTNKKYSQLKLDYTFNDENDPNRFYYRSDHYNFAKNNIPVIFYFNGVHEDYHKTTDTADKINYEILAKRAQLVFYTAWEIANRENRLVVDKK
ncbi:MAG: M28 family metallopeptidase [Flavobacteriaceae bacterium]|nr:M28 family metallopeptidase [Flavobacteriaceae bacterium]